MMTTAEETFCRISVATGNPVRAYLQKGQRPRANDGIVGTDKRKHRRRQGFRGDVRISSQTLHCVGYNAMDFALYFLDERH
mmetsp:Transcript_11000/g.23310  ORF Transcript_11000/g.23310 Transcript_11000/m.23310 type:complete len:81 (-) Transcript_11000:63-305(-)